MPHFLSRALLLALFIFPTAADGAGQTDDPATTIRIGGTGSALATMKIMAQAFKKTHPLATVVLVPSLGSTGGVQALLSGALDLAVISRPLKETERAKGAIATEYARTPLVFATTAKTRVSAITTGELVSIYKGERSAWPDGHRLRLVLRPQSETDTDIVKSLSAEMARAVEAAHARPGMLIAATDQDSADRLLSIPGALGTLTLAQIISEKLALQPLTLNAIDPSPKSAAEGRYRLHKTFSLATGRKTGPVARSFATFVGSAAGRRILEENGQWVAPKK